MAQVKLAVIGVGVMGETHVRATQLDARVELVAICDVSKERVAEVQQRYGVPNAYSDAREMLRSHQIDGVIIATSDQNHVDPVLAAADAGVQIMLEKPIATTIEDAEIIVNAAERARVRLMVGFVLRFTPPYVAIHNRVATGGLGQLTMGYAKRVGAIPEARRLKGRLTVNSYLSVHDIDTLLWNFGTDVASVYATKGAFILKDELKTPDYYWNILKFKNGVTCVAHSLWTLPEGSPGFLQSELVIHGMNGTAHLDVDGQWLRFMSEGRTDAPDFLYGIGEPSTGAYRLEDEHFVECIIKDRQPIVDGVDGVNALKVILAAEESTQSGEPVSLSLMRPTAPRV